MINFKTVYCVMHAIHNIKQLNRYYIENDGKPRLSYTIESMEVLDDDEPCLHNYIIRVKTLGNGSVSLAKLVAVIPSGFLQSFHDEVYLFDILPAIPYQWTT